MKSAAAVAAAFALLGIAGGAAYVFVMWDADAQGLPAALLLAGSIGGAAGLLVGAAVALQQGRQRRAPPLHVRGKLWAWRFRKATGMTPLTAGAGLALAAIVVLAIIFHRGLGA